MGEGVLLLGKVDSVHGYAYLNPHSSTAVDGSESISTHSELPYSVYPSSESDWLRQRRAASKFCHRKSIT